MCGRFYVDDETAREIEKTIRQVDEELRRKRITGDIRPTDRAAVITMREGIMCLEAKRWGFPGAGKQVIFNARAETVQEKRMFREGIRGKRLAVPAAGFYEWNAGKEKITFFRETALYLAGFSERFGGEERFVILTTGANVSMEDVHHRMPLILEKHEVGTWIGDGLQTERFLGKIPGPLMRKAEFQQMTLF